MWWWNKNVNVTVSWKTELFRIWKQSQNEEDRKKYCEVKTMLRALDQKAWEVVEKADSCCDGCELFRIAKQRAGEKENVVGVCCLKEEIGVVKVSVDDRKKIWKEHMEKLMNVENEWSDSIDVSKVEGAVRRTKVEEVHYAMNWMKIRKASGPSGVSYQSYQRKLRLFVILCVNNQSIFRPQLLPVEILKFVKFIFYINRTKFYYLLSWKFDFELMLVKSI